MSSVRIPSIYAGPVPGLTAICQICKEGRRTRATVTERGRRTACASPANFTLSEEKSSHDDDAACKLRSTLDLTSGFPWFSCSLPTASVRLRCAVSTCKDGCDASQTQTPRRATVGPTDADGGGRRGRQMDFVHCAEGRGGNRRKNEQRLT